MEHDLRLLAGHHGIDPATVAHIGEQRLNGQLGPALAQRTIDRVEQVLAVVDEDQPRRCQGGNLAGKLRTDRAAGAGDENPAVADQPGHRLAVEHRLRPPEQILECDRLGEIE